MKNRSLHIDFYYSWSQLAGGRRFHFPFSFTFTNVDNTTYFIFGLLLFECKFFFGEKSPLPEITNEEVLNRQATKLKKMLKKSNGLELSFISKKLKISTNSVKQLAAQNGYLIENEMVFNEKR